MKGLYATPTGEGIQKRHLAGLLVILGAVFSLVLLTIPAGATHVEPTLEKGNPNCETLTTTTEVLRLEDAGLVADTYNINVGSFVGTITVSSLTEKTFDWSATGFLVSAVFVKAGPEGNLYNYLPSGASSDTGLESPGQEHAISHITFCAGGTPPTTTTTTAAETTTTAAETTTTTVPDEVSPTTLVTTTTVAPTTTTTVAVSPSTLPFTGPRSGALIPFAVSLLAAGLLVVLGARRIED